MNTSLNTQKALEGIVDAVATSYTLGRKIDSLESTALPNRRKIVEAISDLEHVCFMGFYSSETLSSVNLRHYISRHVYCASDILVGQIARALVVQRLGGGAPETVDLTQSEQIVTELMATLPELRAQLSLDVEAAFDGDPSAQSVEEIVFSYPAIQAITVYRIAHELYTRDVPMVPRIMAEHAHSITGIEIHPGAKIGQRFFVDHGTGVVIGETARIGDSVKLYQGVTLGALSLPRDAGGNVIRRAKRHPTIEDHVTIYANATILGGDTVIGAGSIIGANTWVTESVAPNTRVSYAAPDGGNQIRESLD
ncbi:MAG: serine O-acetyltransferase [Myxococcales bacterium]|nr:serine O-acetyltransferase [Myxococcales bacterium]MDD9971503.1 serine O-acetyltransferase [Myxococcales bacterium]